MAIPLMGLPFVNIDKQTQEIRDVGIELKKQQITAQIEASKPVPVPVPPPAPIVVQTAPIAPKTPVAPVSDNDAKMFIYFKESGNRPTARNSTGCLGIGQACPGSKLLAVCPDLNDYACQDAFFTKYAMNRYGSWENARQFWLKNSWW